MSHTKESWKIERSQGNKAITSIGPCEAQEYAGAAWLEVSDEDANLMVAAPDLLEACKMAWDYVATDEEVDKVVLMELLEAAIAKATGEQS